MKITISSGTADEPRDVLVEDESGKLASFKAKNLKAAHKMLKQGRTEGWDTVTPVKLAAQAKTETAKEVARVETGKAAAEPKKAK